MKRIFTTLLLLLTFTMVHSVDLENRFEEVRVELEKPSFFSTTINGLGHFQDLMVELLYSDLTPEEYLAALRQNEEWFAYFGDYSDYFFNVNHHS